MNELSIQISTSQKTRFGDIILQGYNSASTNHSTHVLVKKALHQHVDLSLGSVITVTGHFEQWKHHRILIAKTCRLASVQSSHLLRLIRYSRDFQNLYASASTYRKLRDHFESSPERLLRLLNDMNIDDLSKSLSPRAALDLITAWHSYLRSKRLVETCQKNGLSSKATAVASEIDCLLSVNENAVDLSPLFHAISLSEIRKLFSVFDLPPPPSIAEEFRLIKRLHKELRNGRSLPFIHELNATIEKVRRLQAEQLSSLNYQIIISGNYIQLKAAAILESSIRNRLHTIGSFFTPTFLDYEIEEAIEAEVLLRQAPWDSRVTLVAKTAINNRICCLVGDTHSGKSTSVDLLADVYTQLTGAPVYLLSPTVASSHASAYLSGRDCHPISAFLKSAVSKTLQAEALVIVDNAHCLSVPDLHDLLLGLPESARYLFIGSPNHQQPSMWGYPFLQLLDFFPRVEFYVHDCQTLLIGPIRMNLPSRMKLDFIQSLTDSEIIDHAANSLAQIVCASPIRAKLLNRLYQSRLYSDSSPDFLAERDAFFVGDQVIINSDKINQISSGILGTIVKASASFFTISTPSEQIQLSYERLDEVDMSLAYALTPGQSHGIRFDHLIVDIKSNRPIDARTVYSCISRANIHCEIVASREQLADLPLPDLTGLTQRLVPLVDSFQEKPKGWNNGSVV